MTHNREIDRQHAACATLPPAVFAGVEEALAACPNVQLPNNPSAVASPSVAAAPAAHSGEYSQRCISQYLGMPLYRHVIDYTAVLCHSHHI